MDNNKWLYFIEKKNEVLAAISRVGKTPRLEALLDRINKEILATLNGRLESVTRQSCPWKTNKHPQGLEYESSCGETLRVYNKVHKSACWEYCPWCGKEIEYED